MKLQTIIGLETHVQLKTKSKLFSSVSNDSENSNPNAHISPLCVGLPGTLPIVNKQAVKWGVLLTLALNGKVSEISKFDRKHYFYPDLPKGFQTSQFDKPVMTGGHVIVDVPGEEKPFTVELERMHLEDDAAKNIHGEDGKTYVDYNRAGTPLCEIVTKPVIRTSAQAKAYLQELRLIVRTLGISEADMEKGQLRCDVNISLREYDDEGNPVGPLMPKTEIKNVNSFKAVERVIEYEIKRQRKLWEAGEPPMITVTRGWNDAKQITEAQREKEDAADYRYFPEPDLPPMRLGEIEAEMRRKLPELPRAKRARFVNEYSFKLEDAKQIIEDPALAEFSEQALSELGAWLQSLPDITPEEMPERRKKLTKVFSGWLINKLGGLLADRKIDVRTMKITPENFAELITMISSGELTGTSALKVLDRMLDAGEDPSHIAEELGAGRIDDTDALLQVVNNVIEANPAEVERFKGGDKKLMQFFIGQIMKETRGNADPGIAAKIINDQLK